MPTELGAKSNGIAFLVSAGIVYEIIAANCSSPQTAEINAKTRADTLMKWVYIGIAQSAVFIVVAAYFDPAHRAAILWGGSLAALIMWALYLHGKETGLASVKPGTES